MTDQSRSHKNMLWYDNNQQHCRYDSLASFQILLKSEKLDVVAQDRGRNAELSSLVLVIVADGQQPVRLGLCRIWLIPTYSLPTL